MSQQNTGGPVGPRISQKDFKKIKIPPDAMAADISKQPNEFRVRYYYLDKEVVCKKCGKKEIWTTEKQKKWYEEMAGDPDSVATTCGGCRKNR